MIPGAPIDNQAEVAAKVAAEENAARLDRCRGPHKFMPEGAMSNEKIVPGGTGMLRCTKCYGRVTEEQARWYVKGYKHARYR